jgi:large subunit ribosomal protein L15
VRTVNLKDLERIFSDLDAIRIKDFRDRGILSGAVRRIRVLGGGPLKKKFTVFAHGFSRSAQGAIEKLGGEARLVGAPAAKKEKDKKQKPNKKPKGG